MHFGELLRDFRMSRGKKNRSKFAKEVGISAEGLRVIESGMRFPSPKVMNSICEALDLFPGEALRLKLLLLDFKYSDSAAELMSSEEVSAFATIFNEKAGPLIKEVLSELSQERRVENLNYLLGTFHVLIEEILQGGTDEVPGT